jgi:hypothetical protein
MSTAAQAAADAQTRQAGDAIRAANSGRVLNVTPEELIDLINRVTPGQIIAFRRTVMKMTTAKMNPAEFSIYEYQGFDPLTLVKKFLAIGSYYKMKPDKVVNDVMHIIAINLYMGNVSGQNKLERRSQEGKDKISELVAAYQIKLGSTGTGLKPDTITVPRTSAAFPILSTRMATILPTTQTVGMPFKTENIPRCMRVGAFASFLSHNINSPTRDFLMKAVMAYTCDQSIVFSMDRKTRKPTLKPVEAHARQITYIQAAMSSSVPAEWEKGAMLDEFRIPEQYGVLAPIVENFNTVTGLKDSVVSESDYKKDLKAFIDKCQAERTTEEAEGTRIIAEERAARRARAAEQGTGQSADRPTVPAVSGTTGTAPPVATPPTTAAPESVAGSAPAEEDDENNDLYEA